MRIVCYFINYNDSFYIPFLKKHYGKFCERIVMYDNYSTDESCKIASDLGIEIRMFGRKGELNDQHYLDIKNHCWKECRDQGIDYVIVVDADEFVFCHMEIEQEFGSAPTVTGYNMISDSLPIEDIKEIKTGAYSESYSKQAIFNPDKITEIDFVHGCHKNRIKGDVTRDGSCRLLHYRQIGGIERMLNRHAEYRERMSQFNRQHGMGIHYLHEDNAKREEWNILTQQAKELW